MLADLVGDDDAAHDHYRRALELEEQLASPPYIARTKYWYARHLADFGDASAHEQASTLLADVVATTDALGMTALHGQASDLLSSIGHRA